jgi:hypothetical protein
MDNLDDNNENNIKYKNKNTSEVELEQADLKQKSPEKITLKFISKVF